MILVLSRQDESAFMYLTVVVDQTGCKVSSDESAIQIDPFHGA